MRPAPGEHERQRKPGEQRAALIRWGTATHRYTLEERVRLRKELEEGRRGEDADKQDLRIGGQAEEQIFRSNDDQQRPWVPEDYDADLNVPYLEGKEARLSAATSAAEDSCSRLGSPLTLSLSLTGREDDDRSSDFIA